MPVCHKCGRVAASAEMRRTSKQIDPRFIENPDGTVTYVAQVGYVCKDRLPCKARVKEAKRK